MTRSSSGRRTEGFEALKALVAEYTPERVEEISGVPAEKLRQAAEMYAKTKSPSSIVYCMGITQHTVGVDNVLALADLAMVTGQIGKPSSGVNPLRGQNNVQGSTDMGAIPAALPGYQSLADDAAVAKFEKAWGVTLSRKPGLTLMEMMDAAAHGTMKALYVMGENPLVSDPDVGHVKKALEKLDLLIVQDIFPTETTALAHVVLPAVTFAEKDGTFVSTDRRIQRVRKAIEPLGDSRPDWRIICDVAKALGAAGFDYASPKEVFDEIASLVPLYAGVDYDRIRENGIQWPCRTKEDPGTAFLHKGTFSKGLGTLKPIAYKAPAELPDEEFPLTLMTGRDPFHYHTGTMTRRSKRLTDQLNSCYVQIQPDGRTEHGHTERGHDEDRVAQGGDRGRGAGDEGGPEGVRVRSLPFCRGGGQRAHQPGPRPGRQDTGVQGLCGENPEGGVGGTWQGSGCLSVSAVRISAP